MKLNPRSRSGETLLQQLVEDASGSKVATSELLRRVKILAARLRAPDLAHWVAHELNGYGSDAALPAYRGPFKAEARGNFAGPFQQMFKNYPIPPSALPDYMADSWLFKSDFRDSVAELEDLLSQAKHLKEGDRLGAAWDADTIQLINAETQRGNTRLRDDLHLLEAWIPINPSTVSGILDAVRNRTLDLALALESADPSAGEPEAERKVSPQAATNIFHTTVYGGTNVAIGSTEVAQMLNTTPANDDDLLMRLRGLGVSGELLEELRSALAGDRDDAGGTLDGPGSRVWGWLKKVGGRAADAGGDAAVAVV